MIPLAEINYYARGFLFKLRNIYCAVNKPKRAKIDMSVFDRTPCIFSGIDAVMEDVVNSEVHGNIRGSTSAVIRHGLSRGYVRSTTCPVNVGIGVPLFREQLEEELNVLEK